MTTEQILENRQSERAHRGTWAPAVAIGTPTLLVGLHALVYGRWIIDDAAITFAYVRSFAAGLGPVLQPGAAPVEGYSNPAWLALLLLGDKVRLFDHGTLFGVPDQVLFPKLLALACCAALYASLYRVASILTRFPVAVTIVAGAITAAIPSFVIWCFSGLENSLLAAAVGWLAAMIATAAARGRLATTRTALICGLLAALAGLTRPDGVIYLLAYPLAVLLLGGVARRDALRCAAVGTAAFAVPIGALLTWRFLTFGELVPNTAIAKSQGLPGLIGLARPFELVLFTGVAPGLLGAVLVVLVLRDGRTRGDGQRSGLLGLLLVFGLAALAFAILEGDWMGQRRFATPIWATGALIIAVAGAQLAADADARGRRRVLGAGVAAALIAAPVLAHSAVTFRSNPTVPMCAVASYAGWTPEKYAQVLGLTDAAVATPDIGGTALVSDLRIIDLGGLADAQLARRWSSDDVAGLRDDVFAARPEFIEIHHEWSDTTGLIEDPRLAAEYVEVTRTSRTDGMWVRRDVAARLTDAGPLPVAQNAVPLRSDDPYQLVDPLASCGELSVQR
ncbi:hypothetical protein FK535_10870 [Mycolicibacterium sp. 018/SC-01/001]|uniref:hypothetical protein n=1 Tax=Mycolicibacterium sp. 018/SC-01/001 TaxID=2592069 RepID=UPI00117F9CC8|nr:hypothetical protein [Mycolicibacterium sp. 018/SC-01/001]TRW83170.1 hypothetical protein FK535_10870 [Mycolicibacterium sp. 018/SC-01/001]